MVVDWKTGKSHADAKVDRQLGVYGLYALDRWVQDAGQIKAMHVNLREGSWRTFEFNEALLGSTRAFIGESAGEMKGLLQDVDDNLAFEEDFPLLPEGDPRCGRCRFRGDCGRT